ncbi:MAG: hypothetical protein AB7W28_07965 [Armatimonadota bacterium]
MADTNDREKSTDSVDLDVTELWKAVIEGLHRGPVNRSLWDAVARAVPLTIEDSTFVIGFNPRDMRYASYVQTAANRMRIQEILLARSGRRLELRVIEGDTLDAWRRVKQIERLSEERAEDQVRETTARSQSVRAWSELNEKLIKLFSSVQARRYPIQLARLLAKSLSMVYETDVVVRHSDPEGAVFHDRELNRVCDRLATYCDLTPVAVAVEYLRYRSSRRGTKDQDQRQ